MDTPLIKEFRYNAPIDKVWEALTETKKLKEWYFPQIQKVEPVVGFRFQFTDKGAEYQKEWIVTKVTEGKTFAHTWAYKNYPGSSEIKFDLLSEDDNTKLIVTQTDLESFPNKQHFGRERFEWGWNNLLGQNLRHLLENSKNN